MTSMQPNGTFLPAEDQLPEALNMQAIERFSRGDTVGAWRTSSVRSS